MPVLDLNVSVEDNVIMYTFYKKDVTSKYTILKRSALSDSTKRESCFMEALRRIMKQVLIYLGRPP